MEMLSINPYCDRETLKKELERCVAATESTEPMAVYWQTSRGNCRRNHIFPPEGTPTTLLITVTPLKPLDPNVSLKLASFEDKRFQYCNIKTLNLIPNVLAAQYAEEQGCQEAVFHRGKYMTECAHSSLVLLKDGVMLAPPLDELILPSITRAHIMTIAEKLHIPRDLRQITMDEVRDADELIVLSSSKLISRACELDGEPVGGKDTERFMKLRDGYFRMLKEETGYEMEV
jgi:D-alanine transaminase